MQLGAHDSLTSPWSTVLCTRTVRRPNRCSSLLKMTPFEPVSVDAIGYRDTVLSAGRACRRNQT